MGKLFESIVHSDEEIRIFGMQTLVDIGKMEYESVEFYFKRICEVTANAAKHDVMQVGAQGIEFWTSLAEEELRRQIHNIP
jgi:hypothetical protein